MLLKPTALLLSLLFLLLFFFSSSSPSCSSSFASASASSAFQGGGSPPSTMQAEQHTEHAGCCKFLGSGGCTTTMALNSCVLLRICCRSPHLSALHTTPPATVYSGFRFQATSTCGGRNPQGRTSPFRSAHSLQTVVTSSWVCCHSC